MPICLSLMMRTPKTVADELELPHQVCKSHVKRNTETIIDTLESIVGSDADGSLAAIGVTPEQAQHDLKRLGELILSRQPKEAEELKEMHRRYLAAPPPQPGEKATVAYRLRLLFLDRWNLWPRLTRYRIWRGPGGERVDGTNNGLSYHARLQARRVARKCQLPFSLLWQSLGARWGRSCPRHCIGAQEQQEIKHKRLLASLIKIRTITSRFCQQEPLTLNIYDCFGGAVGMMTTS
jgi:hypothetical protein